MRAVPIYGGQSINVQVDKLRRGAAAVSTPGNLHAWDVLSRELGRLPWKEVLEPGIRLAEDGFAIDERTASAIANAFKEFPAAVRRKLVLEIAGGPPSEPRLIPAQAAAPYDCLIGEKIWERNRGQWDWQ